MNSADIKDIDASGSVLFLGAGFSQGATNIQGERLPTGSGLKKQLAKLLRVAPEHYNLETLVDEINSRKEFNIYQILYKLFTVRRPSDDQRSILKLPWRRIYTTNYDDIIESCLIHKDRPVRSYTYDEPKPRKILHKTIIHLHGAIRNTTEENVLDQLILNENSYIRQHFEKSDWYDEFVRDLRFSDANFFVGYSLQDYHIAALLLQEPGLREKTYFVTGAKYDNIFENRIKPHGEIFPIGITGFAKICRTSTRPAYVGNIRSLKAFKYLDPMQDRKTLSKPTSIEILNFVTYGTFNFSRCVATLPHAKYVVPRQELADACNREIKNVRCLLIHSYIGNGKSVFFYILAHKLSAQGYRCLQFHSNPIVQERELEFLRTIDKLVIFIDSYDTAIDYIQQLSDSLPDAKFIVSIRTAVQDFRLHEIQSRLPQPMYRLSLNGISDIDSYNFKELLNQAGVRVPNLEDVIDRCKEFREVIVSLYNNQDIRRKIKDELTPLLEIRKSREIFVTIHLLNWVGCEVEPALLKSVTGADAYVEMMKFPNVTRDVFGLHDDNVRVRSPMFSEYLILNHFDTEDILDCAYELICISARRKEERRYRLIMGNVMRFSNLRRALGKDPDRLDKLAHLFDKLHRNIDVNMEPLFWLQYSILMTASEKLESAEGFIRTAYSRAEARPQFHTFQIDTYALRLFLMIEIKSKESSTVERFDEIVDKMEKVRSMIGSESQRYHAIRVLHGIEEFVRERMDALTQSEKNALVEYLGLVISDLDKLPLSVQSETESVEIRNSVNRARERLMRNQWLAYEEET